MRKSKELLPAIMPNNGLRFLRLSEDIFRENLSELDTYLIYKTGQRALLSVSTEGHTNDLIPKITTCAKNLCSYNAISAPTGSD